MPKPPRERSSKQRPFNPNGITGEPIQANLDTMRPNDWNPNSMTPEEYASLKHGMKRHGWLASHAMLVWGTDERGKRQDLIIDAEHRWTAARELGFDKGPAVYLNGITRAQAMALTVALWRKHGSPDEDKLALAVRYLDENLGAESLSLELGLTDDELRDLLEEPDATPPEIVSKSKERKVPLAYDQKTYDAFMGHINTLSRRFEGKTLSELVLSAVTRLATEMDARVP